MNFKKFDGQKNPNPNKKNLNSKVTRKTLTLEQHYQNKKNHEA